MTSLLKQRQERLLKTENPKTFFVLKADVDFKDIDYCKKDPDIQQKMNLLLFCNHNDNIQSIINQKNKIVFGEEDVAKEMVKSLSKIYPDYWFYLEVYYFEKNSTQITLKNTFVFNDNYLLAQVPF